MSGARPQAFPFLPASDGSVEMRALRDYAAGDEARPPARGARNRSNGWSNCCGAQVVISYGRKTNEALLLSYGFVPPSDAEQVSPAPPLP